MTYLDHMQSDGVGGSYCVHSWREHTRLRLTDQYGKDRAADIMAERDPTTQSDVTAWRKLGEGRKAA